MFGIDGKSANPAVQANNNQYYQLPTQILTVDDVICALGPAALLPPPGPTPAGSVSVPVTFPLTGVRRINLRVTDLAALRITAPVLQTTDGYVMLVSAVQKVAALKRNPEVMNFFFKLGFTEIEICQAALGPQVIFASNFLTTQGYRPEEIEMAETLRVKEYLCRLALADYLSTFKTEINRLVAFGCSTEEIFQSAAENQIVNLISMHLNLQERTRLNTQAHIEREVEKKYLRTKVGPAAVRQHEADNLFATALDLQLSYDEKITYGLQVTQLARLFSRDFIRALFLHGVFDQFYKHYPEHEKDMGYLIKHGATSQILMNAYSGTSVNYKFLAIVFRNELSVYPPGRAQQILRQGRVSAKFKEWLKTKTSYPVICSHNHLTINPLRKTTIKKMLVVAAENLPSLAEGARFLFHGDQGTVPLIAFRNRHKLLELFTWSGRTDSGLPKKQGKLGYGGLSIVQTVHRLATGQRWAMKAPLSNMPEVRQALSAELILAETTVLRQLKDKLGNIPGLIEAPMVVINETQAQWAASITRQYEGDLRDLLIGMPESPDNFKKLLSAFVDVIKALIVFSKHRILHGDLKPDNILYCYEGNQLKFYLADVGGCTYDEFLKGKIVVSTAAYSNDSDDLAIQPGTCLFADELCQRREVYGLGATMWSVFMKQIYIRGDERKDLKQLGNIDKLVTSMLHEKIYARPSFQEVLNQVQAALMIS